MLPPPSRCPTGRARCAICFVPAPCPSFCCTATCSMACPPAGRRLLALKQFNRNLLIVGDRARLQVDAAGDHRSAGQGAFLELPRESGLFLGGDRCRRQLRRDLPVGGPGVRVGADPQPGGCGALRRVEAARGTQAGARVQRREALDRADPDRRGGRHRGDQPALVAGHPVLLRAQLGRTRPVESGESREPRVDQAATPGQPGVDDSAAGPRRQRPRARVPAPG